MSCDSCQHPWGAHLLGNLMLRCTDDGCSCRRFPADYEPEVCAICGHAALEWDTVCRRHRKERELELRRLHTREVTAGWRPVRLFGRGARAAKAGDGPPGP